MVGTLGGYNNMWLEQLMMSECGKEWHERAFIANMTHMTWHEHNSHLWSSPWGSCFLCDEIPVKFVCVLLSGGILQTNDWNGKKRLLKRMLVVIKNEIDEFHQRAKTQNTHVVFRVCRVTFESPDVNLCTNLISSRRGTTRSVVPSVLSLFFRWSWFALLFFLFLAFLFVFFVFDLLLEEKMLRRLNRLGMIMKYCYRRLESHSDSEIEKGCGKLLFGWGTSYRHCSWKACIVLGTTSEC